MRTFLKDHQATLVVIFILTVVTALLAIAAGPVFAQGDNWIIGTDMSDASVYTVYAPTNSVFGPFLGGQLGGQSGGLLDVAVTPDNQTALVSNFGDAKVFFIDISKPTSPVCTGSVMLVSGSLTMFAEDIAITPDGQFALVTDGSFNDTVFSIDIITQTIADVGTIANTAESVDVAPNGTVIVGGYWSATLDWFTIDNMGQLTWSGSYMLPAYPIAGGTDMTYPVNVRIAPDGQTVLALSAFYGIAELFTIDGVGSLVYSGSLSGLPGGEQSIAFNSTGDTGYLLSGSPAPDCLSVLNIGSPGNVILNNPCAARLEQDAWGQLFGVDTAALAGNSIYAGYSSTWAGTPCSCLSVVDLNDFSVMPLSIGGTPISVASFYNSFSPGGGGGPTVGGQVMMVNKSALIAQCIGLPLRLMLGLAL